MHHLIINLPVVKLEADKRKIARDIDALETQMRAEVDPDVDEGDPGLAVQAVTAALLNNARQKAEAIERALNQARSGDYGMCEDCNQPIDPERLKIFPQSTLCVPCKMAREQAEGFGRLKAA